MNNKKVFFAGVLGNVIEFYDFTLFGFFTPLIARLFFPSFDPRTALLLTLAIFSVSFLMRPIGGILFGHIGDRYGRKFALSLSILLMAIPTAAIGLLPAYEEIGIWASLMLLVCRLLQGISAGGEYNGAFILLIEHGRKENAGFIGSLVVSSCALGALLAVFSGSLALHSSMPTWAWRVPFLLGGVVGLVGIYIRTRMEESPEFLQYASKRLVSAVPIIQAIKKEGISIVLTIGVATFCHVLINMMTVYINIYLNVVLNFPLGSALMLNTVALLFFTATVPFVGFISDKIGQINIRDCFST